MERAKILDRLAGDLEPIAHVETPPKLDGRNMTIVFAPFSASASDAGCAISA